MKCGGGHGWWAAFRTSCWLLADLSALTLVFATLEEDQLKWRGLRMDDELRTDIEEAGVQAKEKDVFVIEAVDSWLEAT